MGSRFRLQTSPARLVGLALLAGCPNLLPGDPASQVKRAVDELSAQGLATEVASRPLTLRKLELSEVYVDGQEPPDVLFHVQATGRWGETIVSYYGSERVSFRGAGGRWLAPAIWLPKLEGVLAALAAREAAIAAHDATALARLAEPDNHDGAITAPRLLEAVKAAESGTGPSPDNALSIRIDGDRAQVSTLNLLPGPHAAALVKLGDSWRFTSGLL